MIIAQISDSHIDPQSAQLKHRLEDLRRVVDSLNDLDPAPDIVIHTGDVVHNGSQEKYDLASSILGDIDVPLHVCPGNRDDRNLIVKNFLTGTIAAAESPFLQYSIDHYPVRLIAVDTLSATTNMGDYCQQRADALREMLAQKPNKPTVLFMHHPPFEIVESTYPFQFENWETIDYLTQVLKENTQVKQIFCGHTHRNVKSQLVGVPASTVPSVAVDLRLDDVPKGTAVNPVYHLHKFDGTQFKSQTVVCSKSDTPLRGNT